MDNFQRFEIDATLLRIIGAVLLHNVSFPKFQYMQKMLLYIKTTRANHSRHKFCNMILVAAMMFAPFLSCFSLFISVGQISSLTLAVKAYVFLGFIMKLDYLFTGMLPTSIPDLVDKINSKGGLVIPKDRNTYRLSFSRLWKAFHFRVLKRHSN